MLAKFKPLSFILITLQNSALLFPLLLERAGVYPQGIKGDLKTEF
jgi:hypothetical protein